VHPIPDSKFTGLPKVEVFFYFAFYAFFSPFSRFKYPQGGNTPAKEHRTSPKVQNSTLKHFPPLFSLFRPLTNAQAVEPVSYPRGGKKASAPAKAADGIFQVKFILKII
jgi:hypothetical protein